MNSQHGLQAKPNPFDEVLIWAALATIFISGLSFSFGSTVVYYSYIFMAALYLPMALRVASFGILKSYGYAFIFVFIISISSYLATSSIHNDFRFSAVALTTARMLLFLFYAAFYTLVFYISGGSIRSLFGRYVQVDTVFSLIAILQELTFIASGTDLLSALGPRSKNYGSFLGVAGLSVEPAYFACALLPAAAYAVSTFIRSLRITPSGFIIVTATLLTTSSLGYIGLIIAASLSFLATPGIRGALISVLSAPIAAIAFYHLVSLDFFQLRLNDTLYLITGGTLDLRQGMNISTYANAVNLSIAMRSVSENSGLGVGFGLYSVAFDRYIYDYDLPSYRIGIPGRGSGASFFGRLTAELGVFFWACALVIFAWCLRNIRRSGIDAPIHIAYFSTLTIIFLRMGEYYLNGVILVLVVIYLGHVEMSKTSSTHQSSANYNTMRRNTIRED